MTDLELILNAMTPKQRQRYELQLAGMSLTDIAQKEQVSVPAVSISIKAGLNRAKKRLNYLKKP